MSYLISRAQKFLPLRPPFDLIRHCLLRNRNTQIFSLYFIHILVPYRPRNQFHRSYLLLGSSFHSGTPGIGMNWNEKFRGADRLKLVPLLSVGTRNITSQIEILIVRNNSKFRVTLTFKLELYACLYFCVMTSRHYVTLSWFRSKKLFFPILLKCFTSAILLENFPFFSTVVVT